MWQTLRIRGARIVYYKDGCNRCTCPSSLTGDVHRILLQNHRLIPFCTKPHLSNGDIAGIIDRECVVAAPLWHACRLPQYITIMKKTNEPPEPLSEERLDDELAAEDSDDGLHDYEATQLGKSFLEEMQRVDPAWLQIHDEAATKRELMLAIEVTVNGANLPHVNEWLDSIFEGKKLEMTLTESISDHLKYD